MGACSSVPQRPRSYKQRPSSAVSDRVNLLLDKWKYGHVQLLKRKFKEARGNAKELDKKAFTRLFADLNDLPKNVVASAFRIFDADGSGRINFREFCCALSICCLSEPQEKTKFVFDMFDTNGDGYLQRPELVTLLETSVRCIKKMSNEVHTDGDRTWIQDSMSNLLKDGDRISFDAFKSWAMDNLDISHLLNSFEILPTPQREKRTVKQLLDDMRLTAGETVYVISCKWWAAWKSYVDFDSEDSNTHITTHETVNTGQLNGSNGLRNGADGFDIDVVDMRSRTHPISNGPGNRPAMLTSLDRNPSLPKMLKQFSSVLGDRPGEIDNSDLEGESHGELKLNLVENHDYVIVPQTVWKELKIWYGGGPTLARTVIAVALRDPPSSRQTVVELYPPVLNVLLAGSDGRPVPDSTVSLFASKTMTFESLLNRVCERFQKDPKRSRLWRKESGTWQLVAEDGSCLIQDLNFMSGDVFLLEVQSKDNTWPRKSYEKQSTEKGLEVGDRVDARNWAGTWASGTVVDISADGKVKVHFDNQVYRNDEWFEKGSSWLAPLGSNAIADPKDKKDYSFNQNPVYKRRKRLTEGKPRERGATGLHNLGNTCFVNSTLQCLSNTPLLRDFFLSGSYISDINKANPLGTRGRLAEEFAVLLAELWAGRYTSVYPDSFKRTVDKFAPQFAGFEQHDAQELLAYILDGLHEDLNRVTGKTPLTSPVLERSKTVGGVVGGGVASILQLVAAETGSDKVKSEHSISIESITPLSGYETALQTPEDSNPSEAEDAVAALVDKINKNESQNSLVSMVSTDAPDSSAGSSSASSPPSFSPTRPPLSKANQSSDQHALESDAKNTKSSSASKVDSGMNRPAALQIITEHIPPRPDTRDSTVATESWMGHRRRNRSAIADLFQGQLRSSVQCPDCRKKSTTFDPFMYLTLPLPVQNERAFYVIVYPRARRKRFPNGEPIFPQITREAVQSPALHRFGVWAAKNGTIADLKASLSKVCPILPSRLMLVDVRAHRINLALDDKQSLRHVRSTDTIVAYEVMQTLQDIEEDGPPLRRHETVPSAVSDLRNLQAGDPCDAQDYQGQWWPATVVQTSNGTHVKVHFEDAKDHWDEWYRTDSERLQPFRSQTKEAPEQIIVAPILHRQNAKNRYSSIDRYELFGTPIYISFGTWYTYEELFTCILTQVTRFMRNPQEVANEKAAKQASLVSNSTDAPVSAASISSMMELGILSQLPVAKPPQVITALAVEEDSIPIKPNPEPLAPKSVLPQPFNGSVAMRSGHNRVDPKSDSVPLIVRSLSDENVAASSRDASRPNSARNWNQVNGSSMSGGGLPFTIRVVNPLGTGCGMCDPKGLPCNGCDLPRDGTRVRFKNRIALALDWHDFDFYDTTVSLETAVDDVTVSTVKEKDVEQFSGGIPLSECFDVFTKSEVLGDDNSWYCPDCKAARCGIKKIDLWRTPDILVIHIKRFQYNGTFYEKLEQLVNFPIHGLDLSPWIVEDQKKRSGTALYDLYAVANHMGVMSGGHYTAICKNSEGGNDMWFEFDDDFVRDINQSQLVSPNAYVLFYRRRELSSSNVINLTVYE
eukprot:GILK01007909.1.p1 GENE.GILK01007909.1~~GILK01007909.1.p1  ORF type:complete len:1576 (-),score=341.81 GILK01007909.1:149-4876(-)